MKTLLWLDDIRNPFIADWLLLYAPDYHYEKDQGTHNVVWVKSYNEFIQWIETNGLPDEIGFDHDLADVIYTERGNVDIRKSTWLEKTGMDCAKWLVDFCIDNDRTIPEFFVQSANPVGRNNITNLLTNAKKHITNG